MRRVAAVSAVFLMAASMGFADATVEQKTQFHMEGAVGGLVNAFGGRATHEGLSSTTYVKGNRKSTVIGRNAEIIDIDAEKIYHVDLDRKSYTVTTFDELRRQMEEAKKRAADDDERAEKKKEGPEYVVDFDVKDTGQKQSINGYSTHEVVTTITVHEKGKTLEKGGGGVFTADTWIAPRMREMRELSEFDRRYFLRLYGPKFGTPELQQLAALAATTPTFAKAMKAFSDKKASLDGTPVRTILTYEGVVGTEQKSDDDSQRASSPGAAIGGLLRRARGRHDADNGPQRNKVFESTVELMRAAATASTSDVTVPAGFTQRK